MSRKECWVRDARAVAEGAFWLFLEEIVICLEALYLAISTIGHLPLRVDAEQLEVSWKNREMFANYDRLESLEAGSASRRCHACNEDFD